MNVNISMFISILPSIIILLNKRKDRMLQVKMITGDKTPVALNAIAVTAVDRTGNKSKFKEIAVK